MILFRKTRSPGAWVISKVGAAMVARISCVVLASSPAYWVQNCRSIQKFFENNIHSIGTDGCAGLVPVAGVAGEDLFPRHMRLVSRARSYLLPIIVHLLAKSGFMSPLMKAMARNSLAHVELRLGRSVLSSCPHYKSCYIILIHHSRLVRMHRALDPYVSCARPSVSGASPEAPQTLHAMHLGPYL